MTRSAAQRNARASASPTARAATPRGKSPRPVSASAGASRRAGGGRRKLIVFFSLLGVLTLTSALLLSMAPAPLKPGAYASLFAVGAPNSLDEVFNTQEPMRPGRWLKILVHQSLTAGGDAQSLGQGSGDVGDHFVIGNGDGCVDGEIQICQRWNHQTPAADLSGAAHIDEQCVSICVVGDFNQTAPTQTQLHRLEQLVQALQSRCRIPADRVQLVRDYPDLLVGVGRNFPAAAFRNKLLPGLTGGY